MPMPRVFADLLLAALEHVVVEEVDHLLDFRRAFLELDACVDVFGIFTEDDDVELLRVLHRAGNALVILHRAHAQE